MKKFIFSIMIAITITTTLNASNKKNINLKPINVSKKQLPCVGVAKIDSAIAGDTILGRQRKTKNTYYYNSDMDFVTGSSQKSKNLSSSEIFNPQIVKEYQRIIVEELNKNGYKTDSPSTTSLFEEAKKEDNSRYKIGAIIKKCNVRTIDDIWGNDVTECHMAEVEWQVFDRKSRKVFYKSHTSGWDKKRGVAVQNSAVAAFRKAFRNFLADEKMVQAMKANND